MVVLIDAVIVRTAGYLAPSYCEYGYLAPLGFKLGSGDIDNHVFKMAPYSGDLADRYITHKADLLKRLGTGGRLRG